MKKLAAYLISIITFIFLTSCEKQPDIPLLEECPYEMEEPMIAPDSADIEPLTYTVAIPKGWEVGCIGSHTVLVALPDFNRSDTTKYLEISSYNVYPPFPDISEEVLFTSDYNIYLEAYKEYYDYWEMPASDIDYQLWRGSHGLIAQITVSYTYSGQSLVAVYCFRDDIPYFAYGEISEEKSQFAGQYAPWVLDSLEVEEPEE